MNNLQSFGRATGKTLWHSRLTVKEVCARTGARRRIVGAAFEGNLKDLRLNDLQALIDASALNVAALEAARTSSSANRLSRSAAEGIERRGMRFPSS